MGNTTSTSISEAKTLIEALTHASVTLRLADHIQVGTTFETMNRTLENFIYRHGFKPIRTYRDEHHMKTVWCFEGTQELVECITEWEMMQKLREEPGVNWNDSTNHDSEFYETANQRLEKFLWQHGIAFYRHRITPDRVYVWIYHDSPILRAIVEEFKDIQRKSLQSTNSIGYIATA